MSVGQWIERTNASGMLVKAAQTSAILSHKFLLPHQRCEMVTTGGRKTGAEWWAEPSPFDGLNILLRLEISSKSGTSIIFYFST